MPEADPKRTIEESDRARVTSILKANDRMNFVQRVLKPQEWPVLRDETAKMRGGEFSTHSMAWSTVKGAPVVYPTVIYDPETKGLKRLGFGDALSHALSSGEFISFSSPAEADWFSQHYKLGSGSGFANPVKP